MDGISDSKTEMDEFLGAVASRSLQPLWIDTAKYVPRQPSPLAVPAQWKFRDVRTLLERAGALLREGEADRRVLVLNNPGLPPFSGTTGTLHACVQLLLPGEHAPEHRHTQNAFRLVLEGDGAYTTVDGTRLSMKRGDFILTPAWTWHRHGHDGTEPMIWLDGLDNAIVNLFDASFFEPSQGTPVPAPPTDEIPHLRFPYEEARAKLEALRQAGAIDPAHGFSHCYTDPRSGGPVLATIDAALHLLPQGFASERYRATDAAIYVVLEGEGRTWIGDEEFAWKPNDVFVSPGWAKRRHEADTDVVLFSFSDRVAQEKLSLWREERGLK